MQTLQSILCPLLYLWIYLYLLFIYFTPSPLGLLNVIRLVLHFLQRLLCPCLYLWIYLFLLFTYFTPSPLGLLNVIRLILHFLQSLPCPCLNPYVWVTMGMQTFPQKNQLYQLILESKIEKYINLILADMITIQSGFGTQNFFL